MKIIKVYTETTTAEKLYSVMLTEDEVALFSKMEDEDYLDEQRDRKRSVKHAKAKGAFLGGTTGAILGGRIGSAVSKNALKGGLFGAGIGAGEGYLISKGFDHYRTNKLKKNPKAYEKDIDRINVAEGKMSKEDFAKKYYKK